MKRPGLKIFVLVLLLGAAAGAGWLIFPQLQDHGKGNKGVDAARSSPVETALIETGPIVLKRTFSGTLEPLADFVVSPKVSGRIEKLLVDISDTVTQGQVVGQLDNAEYVQAVTQAQADLVVAEANLAKAKSDLENADRELERTRKLLKRGIASDSEFDALKADQLAKKAQLQVAQAQVTKAASSLETTKIRLGYTRITASWTGGDDNRLVAERYYDEGQTVAANQPLLLIVELDPILGVVYVTEKDYAHLRAGQTVSLTTDAYGDSAFFGRIERIAPVFQKTTRQARVEMIIENPGHRLKPGMFMRAAVVLKKVFETTIVPEQALTTRDNKPGVFVVSKDGKSVIWRPVELGIREGGRVQVEGEGLSGRVVTLGQQLLKNGSAVTVPEEKREIEPNSGEEPIS
ncbi:MAG: efflux RND transporter periplasmic adaptor subunit [Deltaproteobacteria bacterium]|nr:efflux RND transporter periplasmic adaptor subunit [Deltaproteobacteria bacterium]